LKSTILLLLSCATLVAAQNQSSSAWKEYVFQVDGFAITAPEQPTHHVDMSTPEFMVYSIPLPAKNVMNLRVSNRTRDCASFLGKLKDGALQGKNGMDPASVKNISLEGNPGVEYQWISPLHSNLDRYYCVSGRFYVFSASWQKGESRPPIIDRVESSLRLLKPESK
jgi:hypothetical protein